MIGYLSGEVLNHEGDELLLKLPSGIGYLLWAKGNFIVGSHYQFYVAQIFRENQQDLYGFLDWETKKLFEQFLKVKGVGPKTAFNLVSYLTQQQIMDAIQFDQKKIFTSIPGVGAKMAAQIVLDLKGKLKLNEKSSLGKNPTNQSVNLLDDVLLACKELGLAEKNILPLAKEILQKQSITRSEDLLQHILKEI
jgi:Holliday junction DNA helicase RuvA